MCFQVLRVLDKQGGVDNGCERFGGEVARLLALQGREVGLDRVILVELCLDIVVARDKFL